MLKKLLLATLALSCTSVGFADSAWKQFQDSTTKFSVSYPANLTPQKKFDVGSLIPSGWSSISTATDATQVASIVQFTLLKATVNDKALGQAYAKVYWRAAVNRNTTDIANCYKPDADNLDSSYAQGATVTYNGLGYKKYIYTDAGMSQSLYVEVYRYQATDGCYDLEFIKANTDTASVNALLKSKDALATKMFNSVTISG